MLKIYGLSFYKSFNNFCASQTTLIVLSGILVGFFSDKFALLPDYALSVILFLELFLACFKINFADIRAINILKISVFFLLRYIILPVVFYYAISPYSEMLAVACLLLVLLPAGVSSPGFASVFNANITETILLVVLSSILAPIYIPGILSLLVGKVVELDPLKLFLFIFILVVVPIIVHLPCRKVIRLNNFIKEYNPALLMPLVWITILVPVSRIRFQFFNEPVASFIYLSGFLLLYFFFMFFAWQISVFQKNKCHKSYLISSVIHNITLGVVVALTNFDKEISFLLICANISLLFAISLIKPIFLRLNRPLA